VDTLLLQRKARINMPPTDSPARKVSSFARYFSPSSETHPGVATLALDHPKWMLRFNANLFLDFLDLADRFVQRTAFTMFS
jgi:hypothetical protein